MSRTRYEWTLLDWAIWAAGAVPVPLYETSSAEQVALDPHRRRRVPAVRRDRRRTPPSSTRSAPTLPDAARGAGRSTTARVDALATEGARRGRRRDRPPPRPRGPGRRRDDHLHLGHHRPPEGRDADAPATSTSLTVNAVEGPARGGRDARARAPCCSCRWRTCSRASSRCSSIAARCDHRAHAGHQGPAAGPRRRSGRRSSSPSPACSRRSTTRASRRPSRAARGRSSTGPPSAAIAYSRALDTPSGPSLALRLQHKVADVLVLSKLRAALGGQVGVGDLGRRARSVSGSGHFYRGVGLKVLEGYGLTETTAPATVNLPDRTKIGTVGPPLPGTAVRIAAGRRDRDPGPPRVRRLPPEPGRDRRGVRRRLVPHR